jgi:methionyl aminopeptidase
VNETTELKTSVEVMRIRKPSRILGELYEHLDEVIVPGISTGEIDRKAAEFVRKRGARTAQLGFGGFPASTCTSVNNVAAHGLPRDDAPLESGDIVTVDCVIEVDGWHSDAAWTYTVGAAAAESRRLIRAAWRSTFAGIASCRAGQRLGAVADAVQRTARRFGCVVLPEFSGHGIGRGIHEDPSIPYSAAGASAGAPIVPGMVLTVEPVVSLGEDSATRRLNDGWSYVTRDGSRTAQYEHTVAVFSDRTEILTSGSRRGTVDYPPFT